MDGYAKHAIDALKALAAIASEPMGASAADLVPIEDFLRKHTAAVPGWALPVRTRAIGDDLDQQLERAIEERDSYERELGRALERLSHAIEQQDRLLAEMRRQASRARALEAQLQRLVERFGLSVEETQRSIAEIEASLRGDGAPADPAGPRAVRRGSSQAGLGAP